MTHKQALALCLKVMKPFERAYSSYAFITVPEMKAVADAVRRIEAAVLDRRS
jgi:hypothetical protein